MTIKWILIAIGAVILVVMSVAILIVGSAGEERLGGSWVVEHVSAWNPDGRSASYLARRGRSGLRRVSGPLLDARYVEDDCVIYSGYDRGLYGVCGDAPSVYIATLGRESTSLNSEVITAGSRSLLVADIKRAAREILEEPVGGAWLAQREALPDPSEPMPRYVLFRKQGNVKAHQAMPVLSYRYLDDDCLLFVNPPEMLVLVDPHRKAKGNFPVFAACGARYETYLGTVDRPSDIWIGDEVPIEGEKQPLGPLKQRALAERER